MSSNHSASLARTYLFVPGNRAERFDKAFATEADRVILDLEDAVTAQDKPSAREAVARWLAAHPEQAGRAVVRINDAGSQWHDQDVEALAPHAFDAVMLPKSESAAQVEQTHRRLPRCAILALVESAAGLLAIESIARAAGLRRIAFGTLDYALDLDLSGDERGLIEPSSRIAQASRAAGLASPIAGVTPRLDDEAQLLRDYEFARAFGFGAKMCIHPRQVQALHRAMRPGEEAVAWAERVIAAANQSSGAVQLDGKMIDRPVLVRAQRILELAHRPDGGAVPAG